MVVATAAEVRAALAATYPIEIADNVTRSVEAAWHGAVHSGRRTLMKLSSGTLRACTQSAGFSSKGLQPELAMRMWDHILLTRAPADKFDPCTRLPQPDPSASVGQQLDNPADVASPVFIRKAHEQNVFVKLVRPLRNGSQHHGYQLLGFTHTAVGCEALCGAQPECEAYTWFLAEAPDTWANGCIGMDLKSTGWAPFRSRVAHSAVKIIRSGTRLTTPRNEPIVSTFETSRQEPCARRMEVFPGKLDVELLKSNSVPVGKTRSAHDCHNSCLRATGCNRSVWTDPKGSSLLRHACFHLNDGAGDSRPSIMLNSRRASSARKGLRTEPTWQMPYRSVARHLLSFHLGRLEELAATAARVARNSSFALVALHREQLPLARQFLCEMKQWADVQTAPLLWLCSDSAACAFLQQNGFEKLTFAPSEGFLVVERLRVSLCAVLLGYNVLLADPGAVWLQSPWPWLSGPFDIIASPEQRLGEGFGFSLGADFLFVRSTNGTVNVLLQLLERVESSQAQSVKEAAALMSDSMNDLLFYGVTANGSLVRGRLGAQMRRNEWTELRVKVLDMESFPPAHVAMKWWRLTRRPSRGSRIVVVRTHPEKGTGVRLSQLKDIGTLLPSAQRGASECLSSGQSFRPRLASIQPPPPVISVVMLFHNHIANIEGLCNSLLPCHQNETDRLVRVARDGRVFSLQAVIVEDGSTDGSLTAWRKQLAQPGASGISWMSRSGEGEAAVAFPFGRRSAVADLLLLAPNQHEIRSYHEGFSMSWGDVLVTLQDDELYHEGNPGRSRRWLEDALKLFELHPDLAQVTCNAGFLRPEGFACDMFDPRYKENCCYINKTSGCWGEEIAPIPMYDPRLPDTPFMFVAGVNFGPSVTRRDAYFSLGAFDTSWSLVGDPGIGYDIEFSLRAQKGGHLVGVMQCDGIQRRVGGGSSLASASKRRLRYVMERRNNLRLDQLYFNNKKLMRSFITRAMRANRRRLVGALPLVNGREP